MLAMMADMAGGCANAFEMLESVDMTFPEITDEEGNKVTLTHGNFGVFRESGDQRVRKEAFEAYFGEFKKYINPFAATYSGSVKADCFFSSVRRYGSAREQALAGGKAVVSLVNEKGDGLQFHDVAVAATKAIRADLARVMRLFAMEGVK